MSKTFLQRYQDEAAEPAPTPLLDSSEAEALASQLAILSDLQPLPFGGESRDAVARLDLACQRLCLTYATLPSTVREHVRAAVNSDQGWILLEFSRRSAKLARRAANPVALRCSLVAHAVAGFRHGEPRDSILALDEIRSAAVALGLDVGDEFRLAASLAGPTLAKLFTDTAKGE